ncbi:hypothetical protein GW17_00045720 [Ensete ventricosum]|nr:hypothetical protein GW17_00045720 [Ensete ventricosum]
MEPSIERCIVLRRGAASFLREETKRRLIPTRGDEASPRSPFSFPSPFSPHLLVQGEGSPPTKNRQRATDCVGNRGRAGEREKKRDEVADRERKLLIESSNSDGASSYSGSGSGEQRQQQHQRQQREAIAAATAERSDNGEQRQWQR